MKERVKPSPCHSKIENNTRKRDRAQLGEFIFREGNKFVVFLSHERTLVHGCIVATAVGALEPHHMKGCCASGVAVPAQDGPEKPFILRGHRGLSNLPVYVCPHLSHVLHAEPTGGTCVESAGHESGVAGAVEEV